MGGLWYGFRVQIAGLKVRGPFKRKRSNWRFPHAMLAGTKNYPTDTWHSLMDGLYYASPFLKENRPIADGAFQGYTVFSDSIIHAAMWDQAISTLIRADILDSGPPGAGFHGRRNQCAHSKAPAERNDMRGNLRAWESGFAVLRE